MKVLMAAPFEANGRYRGGIGSVANTIMDHDKDLRANGLDVIEFNTCAIDRQIGSDASIGLDNIKNSLILYSTICSAVYESDAEVLYYHSSVKIALLKDLLVLRHAKRKTGIKTVIHIHFAEYQKIMSGNRLIDGMILEILKKDVDEVVFLSKGTMESFIEHGLAREKCNVIYNFSTLDIGVECMPQLHQDGAPVKFLFIGSICKRKGFFDLADVMSSFNEENIQLHVCGATSNQEAEEHFAALQETLGEKLVFHGFVSGDERERVYRDADALVLPSYGEGLPMVIMEAFSAGCAVISTDVGAIPEIVEKKNGIIIHPGDKDALKQAIKTLIENSKQLKQIQEYNIACARDYTCEKFIEKLNAVCRKG